MARKTASQEQAELVAQVVYTDSNLAERGIAMYEAWAREADDLQDQTENLWAEDWQRVMRAFRRTDGAVKQLNFTRQMEELGPLESDEDLEEFFEDGEDWKLLFAGQLYGFTLRVWNFLPWDGNLAFALAFNEDESAAVATNVS